jgi:hypothetical protein
MHGMGLFFDLSGCLKGHQLIQNSLVLMRTIPSKKIDFFSAEKYGKTRRKVKHFQR